jgi:hydroxymethylpyrimidine kinase / phosphomethylpyrimidine kinase / thiamine-phosphate diphosphorylase
MNLEETFFSSQPYFPPKRKIDLLVIDFDGTCTTKDTSPLIAQTAINAVVSQVSSAEGEATSLSVKSELESKLDALVKNYAQKRDHLLQETLPSLDQLTPEEEEQLEDEFDMVWLGEFMDRLSDFDREMNKVVVESSILAGIKRGMLAKTGASSIEMRPGCLEFIEKAVGAGIPVCIVSVNWSAEMVAAALAQGGADSMCDGTINNTNRSNGTGAALPVVIADALGGAALGGGAELSPPPHGTLMVYCNELEYFGDCSTGNLRRRCECGGDKARLFDDLLLTLAAADFGQHQHQRSSSLFNDVEAEKVEEKWLLDGEGAAKTATAIQKQQQEEEEEENVRGMNIYIGDSMTDVPPLISADLGIVIGEDPLIRRVMDVAGIHLQPLTAVPLSLGNEMGYDASEKPTLYEAPCWGEIDALLFNQQFVAPSSSLSSAEQQERVALLQEELGNRQLQQTGSGGVGVGGVEALPPFISTPAATSAETSSQQMLTTQQGLVGGEHNASTVSLATTSSSSPALQFRLSTDDSGPQYILPTPPAATSQLQQQQQQPQPQQPQILTAAASLASSSFALHSLSLPRKISSFREANIPQVLSIAGSDSGGGAGIQADLKTCMALGVFGSCAVTALTAQNTFGVEAIHLPPPEFVRRQIAAVMKDVSTQYSSNNSGSSGGDNSSVAAAAAAALAVNCTTTSPLLTSSSCSSGGGRIVVKIGMLGCTSTVEAVAEELSIWGTPPIVLDPVLIATSGDSLASGGVAQAIVQHLFPLATIVTPNIPEACRLLDDEGRVIIDVDGMKAAAEELMRLGKPKYVLIKGGHLNHTDSGTVGGTPPPPPSSLLSSLKSRKEVVDILYDGRIMLELRSPWVPTNNTHGTGCTLSSAIAAELAKGADVAEAVRLGRQYLWRTLERSAGLPLGNGGTGRQRAMNHGWKIADWKTDLLLLSGSGGENSSIGGGSFTGATARVPPTTTINRIPNPIDLSLYAVTDEKCNAKWGRNITEAVAAVLEGGATVVQLREKDTIYKNNNTGQLVELGCQLLQMCRNKGVPLIINDRLDVCLAVGADGLHVGQGDLNAATARKLLGPDKILGVSVKTVEEAIIAERSGADYLGAGAVYATGTKEDSSVVGVGRVVEIRGKVGIPVVAIGGIGGGNVEEVMRERKVDGVAVVSAVFDSEDVVEATRVLKRKVVGVMREGGGS